MNKIAAIKATLQAAVNHDRNKSNAVFFKTGVGHYAEHDVFIGVSVPIIRKIAKEHADLSFKELQKLIASKINEERLLALIILVTQYQRGDKIANEEVYNFYLNNMQHVSNWNLVDSSAHLILGAHLYKKNKNLLLELAKSEILWQRRIAIVATWYFIRNDDLAWTFKIAKILLKDDQDLIHKAVGWMLREAGKRDQEQLIEFLDQHAATMPRTMLRYAIEKFSAQQRKAYLLYGKKH